MLATAGPWWTAAADCQPAGALEEVVPAAPIVFVGTVTAVVGPAARFEVTEVWAGAIEGEVEVRGLTDGDGPDAGFGQGFSEDDRHWEIGTTYLVVPYADGGTLRDNICTATTVWTDELAALRPAEVAPGGSGGEPATEPEAPSVPVTPIVVVALATLVVGISFVAFRRRGEGSG